RRIRRRPCSTRGDTALPETSRRLTRTTQVVSRLARHRRILSGMDWRAAPPVELTVANVSEAAEAKAFAADLEALGPAFIKLGQSLSTRPDLVPAAYIDALDRIQDEVGPVETAVIEKIIEEELGAKISRVFASFDPVQIGRAHV